MRKLNVLAWMDSPLSITGFGRVAKNLLGRLYKTNKYNIHCIGINHFDEHWATAFEGRESVPYKVSMGQDIRQTSPNTLSVTDPMGRGKLVSIIQSGGFDVLFLMRDLWDMVQVGNNFDTYLPLHIQLSKERGNNFRVVNHFPLEYQLHPGWEPILDMTDYGYCFTAGGMSQLSKWGNKVKWCPQGADDSVFRPLVNFDKDKFREERMRIPKDAFVVLNVNRNQPRKDIPATLEAFAKFKQSLGTNPPKRPILWLHMKPDDAFGDMRVAAEKYGLVVDYDVFFPAYFNVATGWTETELNMVYNSVDVFISTSVAEGFGLTPVEAGMAGCPVLVPGHTGFLQTVGSLGMPYIQVKPEEMRQDVAPSPISPTNTDHLAKLLMDHYNNPEILFDKIKKYNPDFRKKFSWDNIYNQYWDPMFSVIYEDIVKTPDRQVANAKKFFYVCEEAAGDVIGATKALDTLKKTYPNTPIDFMTKNKFKDIVTGNPNINKIIDWDINKIFDYPKQNVFYPHAKIRHGSWSNGVTHLLDMQAEMIGIVAGDPFILPEEFDPLLDDIDGSTNPYITINTTSQGGKMITPEKWAELIRTVISHYPDLRFLLVGGKEDMMVPGAIDFRGLPYRQMAWLQKNAICHIGIDSGPGHFADAVETPSFIFWGWTNLTVCKPQNYSINVTPHYPSVCPRLGPCHGVTPACGINQYDTKSAMTAPCIQSIDVSIVANMLLEALNKYGVKGAKFALKSQAKKLQPLYMLPNAPEIK